MPDSPAHLTVAALLVEWEHLFGPLVDRWRATFLADPSAHQIVRDHGRDRVRLALQEAGPKLEAVLDLLEQPTVVTAAAKAPRRIDRWGFPWTPKEDDYLREAWIDRTPVQQMAQALARSTRGIELRLLGLKLVASVDDIYLRQENQGNGGSAVEPDNPHEGWGGHWDDAPFDPADLWPDEGYREDG